jgi:Ser/Thr protein kinase RdoA (MazF antagonist)
MIDRSIPSQIVLHLLQPLHITATQPISGGLSGAHIWRCQSAYHGQLCLRQWPLEHPDAQRLEFIHAAINYARTEGLDFVPQLYKDQFGRSFHSINDCFWEVTQWLPGEADYLKRPSPKKLESAIDALARLHRCWRGLRRETGMSPTMCERAKMLKRWLNQHDLMERIGRLVRSPEESQLSLTSLQQLQLNGPQILGRLEHMSHNVVTLQPVVRDVWSEHLLFERDKLVGIVDYGALRIDEPAVDLARMLGSLEPFSESARQAALAIYNGLSADCPQDLDRVSLLDLCSSLLTALQWMQWLVEQRRTFDTSPESLFARWKNAIARLAHLTVGE